jgi:hypothetical protein
MYTRDLLTATRHHPELEALNLTVRCSKFFRDLVAQYGAPEPRVEHVKRIYYLVVGHRVRVRNEDEWLVTRSEDVKGMGLSPAEEMEWEKKKEKEERYEKPSILRVLNEIVSES